MIDPRENDDVERHDAREMLAALLPRLRRLGAALSGSLAAGDELVAATLRWTLGALDQWPEGTRFDSWVFRVLHGLSVTPERRARRGEGMDWKPDDRMILHNARVAVAALPEMQRLVMALVDVEGLSYREAARTLGLPLSDLAVYLARARAGVAEALGLELGEARRSASQAAFPNDLLIAAADGELSPPRMAEIAAHLDRAPELEGRRRVLQETGKLVEEAYQDILQEEVPSWLEAELRGTSKAATPEFVPGMGPPPRAVPAGRPSRRIPAMIVVAALLLAIGVVAVASPRLPGLGGRLDAARLAASPSGISVKSPTPP